MMNAERMFSGNPHQFGKEFGADQPGEDHDQVADQHARENGVHRFRRLAEQKRARLDPMEEKGPHHHGRGPASRESQGEQGDHGAPRGAVDGSLRSGQALPDARAEFFGMLGNLLFHAVAHKGGNRGARSRDRPDDRPDAEPAEDRVSQVPDFPRAGAGWSSGRSRVTSSLPFFMESWSRTSPMAKRPINTGDEIDSRFHDPGAEGEARDAVDIVHADGPEEHADEKRDQGAADRNWFR